MTVPDGSVVLDTDLDETGFQAGGEKLMKALEKLTGSMNNLSEIMIKAFSGTEAVLQRVGDSASRMGERTSRSAAKADKSIEELERDAEGFRQEMENLEGVEIPTEQYEKAQEELEKYKLLRDQAAARRDELSRTPSRDEWDYAAAAAQMEQYEKKIQEITRKIALLRETGADFQPGEQSPYYQQIRAELEEVENKLREIRELDDAADMENLSAGIQRASAEADRFQAKVDRMSDLGAADRQWDAVAYDLDLAAERAGQLREELDSLGQSDTIDTEEYERLSEELDQVTRRYQDLREAVAPIPDQQERWDRMATATQMLEHAFEELRNTASVLDYAVARPAEAADRALGFLAQTVGKVGSRLLQMAGTAVWNGIRAIGQEAANAAKHLAQAAGAAIISGFRRLGQAAAEAAKNVMKLSAAAVTGGVRRLGAWLSSAARSMLLFGRSAKGAEKSLGANLLTLLKTYLSFQGLIALARRMAGAVKEGFGNLTQYSDSANAAISSVTSALGQLKNQMAASFSPIVQIAAPALTYLINLLNQAVAALGAFFSALTGKSVFIRAKAVQKDFAGSLNKTAFKTFAKKFEVFRKIW